MTEKKIGLEFVGIQENVFGLPCLDLWNTLVDFVDIQMGSTVTGNRLRRLGVYVPGVSRKTPRGFQFLP